MSKWGKGEQRPKDKEDKSKKKERRENKNLILGRIGIYRIEPSNTIYKMHAYFINRATNACNNSECNNIIFLIRVPSLYAMNLHNGRMIVMLIWSIFYL